MPARKFSMLALATVAVSLALTACDNTGTDNTSSATTSSVSAGSSASTSTSQSSSTAKNAQGTAATTSGTPKKSGVKCTDQINYAEDSRSNAEINSIGEETGYCPPVQHQ